MTVEQQTVDQVATNIARTACYKITQNKSPSSKLIFFVSVPGLPKYPGASFLDRSESISSALLRDCKRMTMCKPDSENVERIANIPADQAQPAVPIVAPPYWNLRNPIATKVR